MKNCSPIRGGQQKWSRNNEGYRIRSPRRSPQNTDEDLALFHDMRALENKNFLHPCADDMEASLPTKLGGLTGFRICASPAPAWKGNDLLAIAESEKTDYDWLLTPPGTPLFPSLDKDSLQKYMDHSLVSQSSSASKGSRFSGSDTPELQRTARRSPGPRTPTSIASSTSSTNSVLMPRAFSPSRAGSSPTLRPSTPSKASGRSTTFTNKASTRSSPPRLRRTNTSPSNRSSSTERSAASSKPRNSISAKLQTWQAPELGFSAEPPPNLRTSISDRPISSLRSGTGRPRMGVQEVRHHQEARHSYSDTLESRRSHWRTSSSSTSRLSSTTTSQDRWSSRGSMFSSSDDGIDAMEPTFLDFCVTSPPSASGASKIIPKRLDNEASCRCSPPNRQKKSPISNMETARFSSSARKSLESCMQRADHSRVPQTMFRPLMSSAPTNSYCNIGCSVARHKSANYFVEPSVTASSNASSERGMRIFPGNESSEDEVESEWDKNMPATVPLNKFAMNESNVAALNSQSVHDPVEQYEQESVADNASTTMDVCEQKRVMILHTHECESSQANRVPDSKEEDQNRDIPRHLVKEMIPAFVKDSTYQPTNCFDSVSSVESPFTNNTDNVWKVSASLHPDAINLHPSDSGQKETEVYDACHNYTIPHAANDANCKNATQGSMTDLTVSPLERHGIASDSHRADQNRMEPTTLESTSDSFTKESAMHSENHISSLDVCAIIESSLPIHTSPLESSTNFSEQYTPVTRVLLQDISVQGIEKSPYMCSFLSEEGSARENSLVSSESVIEGKPVLGHVTSEQFQSEISVIEDGKSSHCLKPREDESIVSSMTGSGQPSSIAGKMKYNVDASCKRDYSATPEEIEENNCLNRSDFVSAPEKCLLDGNDSKKLWEQNGTDSCPFTDDQGITVDNEGIKENINSRSGNEVVEVSSKEDKDNFSSCNVLGDLMFSSLEILDPGPQENGPSPIVLSSVADSSIDCPSIAKAFREECLSNSASLENIPFVSGNLGPDCTVDAFPMQEDAQAETSSTFEGPGVKSTASEVNSSIEKDDQQQPQRGTPHESSAASCVHRAATPSFSLEEATNTILFCSSIIHDLVYKAASIATSNEAEAVKITPALVHQSRGLYSNSVFISSLREKMSKSATWKARHKEAKPPSVKVHKEEVAAPAATITESPTLILAMVRESARLEADKPLADNSKDRSFMGISVNNNCQCSIM